MGYLILIPPPPKKKRLTLELRIVNKFWTCHPNHFKCRCVIEISDWIEPNMILTYSSKRLARSTPQFETLKRRGRMDGVTI